jgi:hypothetical protein
MPALWVIAAATAAGGGVFAWRGQWAPAALLAACAAVIAAVLWAAHPGR